MFSEPYCSLVKIKLVPDYPTFYKGLKGLKIKFNLCKNCKHKEDNLHVMKKWKCGRGNTRRRPITVTYLPLLGRCLTHWARPHISWIRFSRSQPSHNNTTVSFRLRAAGIVITIVSSRICKHIFYFSFLSRSSFGHFLLLHERSNREAKGEIVAWSQNNTQRLCSWAVSPGIIGCRLIAPVVVRWNGIAGCCCYKDVKIIKINSDHELFFFHSWLILQHR